MFSSGIPHPTSYRHGVAILLSLLVCGCFTDPKIDPSETRYCQDIKHCPWGSICGPNNVCCESADGKTCKTLPPGGLDAPATDTPQYTGYDVSIQETGLGRDGGKETGDATGLDGGVDTNTDVPLRGPDVSSGGAPGTGGVAGSGGLPGTGGMPGTGGTAGMPGTGAIAGMPGTGGAGGFGSGGSGGGATGTGGRLVGTGGGVGTGGITGTGGTTTCQPKSRDCTSALDNDCNGTPDNQEASFCACPVGSPRACQEHAGYDGTGICKAGSQTCAASTDKTTSSWGACSGAVPPGTEVCDAGLLDENCNGQSNEGCECINGASVPCECGPATTCTNGTKGACSPAMNCAKIAAHGSFTCSVVSGAAKCWGSNGMSNRGTIYSGYLGSGQSFDQLSFSALPLAVSGLGTGVQDISIGGETSHACAVVNGALKCWGSNYYGQVGDGTTVDKNAPAQVTGLTSGVVAVGTGVEFTCALANGQVRCWGHNVYGEIGLPTSQATSTTPVTIALSGAAQAIAVGSSHACALVSGSVWCWGDNWNGAFGNNTAQTSAYVPVQTTALGSNVTAIAAGHSHTCAVANGSLKCWGLNSSGQLGDATLTERWLPVQVQGLTSGVQAIAAGMELTCAVVNGAASCWGVGLAGGLENDTPQGVIGLGAGVLPMITAGDGHACALTTGGVKCWGSNSSGELGNNATADSPTPVSVQGL